jgi:hypothetical protein
MLSPYSLYRIFRTVDHTRRHFQIRIYLQIWDQNRNRSTSPMKGPWYISQQWQKYKIPSFLLFPSQSQIFNFYSPVKRTSLKLLYTVILNFPTESTPGSVLYVREKSSVVCSFGYAPYFNRTFAYDIYYCGIYFYEIYSYGFSVYTSL